MELASKYHAHYLRYCSMLLSALLLACVALLAETPGAQAASAQRSLVSCPTPPALTSSSLLVVLLDRSGSLTAQPGATDPQGYSTSITEALADLWPGTMVVIPFGNDHASVLGPYALGNAAQRADLKNAIQSYPIGGDTPLAPALQRALTLLQKAPSGSRAMLVTDGSPDPLILNGVNQLVEIAQTLLPQFCQRGISVSTFGLALDQTAQTLLREIASTTGGSSVDVQSAAQLARAVVQLYSQWQHLAFVAAPFSRGDFTIPIDTYAQRVIFVAFRTDNSFKVTLKGPDGQSLPAQAVQRSVDRHYEIDDMLVSTVNQPGIYSVSVSGDPNAQVYALVKTGLHAVLLQPGSQTSISTGQPLVIQAELMDDQTPVVPRPQEATINVAVSILVNGQPVYVITVELVQTENGALFSRQILLPGLKGQLHLQIAASYLQIPVEATQAQITLSLSASTTTTTAQDSACGPAACIWQVSPLLLPSTLLGLCLLFLAFLWLLPTKFDGWLLTQNNHTEDLGRLRRSPLRRLFSKSVLNSKELEDIFDFHGVTFELVLKHEMSIRVLMDKQKIKVQHRMRTTVVCEEDGCVEIVDKDVILIEKCAPALLTQKRNEHV